MRSLSKEYREVIIAALLEQDGRDCGVCKKPLDDRVHLDHIVPVASGGPNRMSNYRLAHPACNLSEGSGGRGGPLTRYLERYGPKEGRRLYNRDKQRMRRDPRLHDLRELRNVQEGSVHFPDPLCLPQWILDRQITEKEQAARRDAKQATRNAQNLP